MDMNYYVKQRGLSCRLAEVFHPAAEGAASSPRAGVFGQPTGRDHQRHRRQGERVRVSQEEAVAVFSTGKQRHHMVGGGVGTDTRKKIIHIHVLHTQGQFFL